MSVASLSSSSVALARSSQAKSVVFFINNSPKQPYSFSSSFQPSSLVSLSSSTLTFSSSPLKLHSLSSTAISQNSHLTTTTPDDDDEYEYEEEQVIGDCLVFEDGIFDDPFPQHKTNPTQFSSSPTITHKPNRNKSSEIEAENLVPDEWKQVVDEINLTKKERRTLAQANQFGQRILKKSKLSKPNLEDYLRYKDEKLAQLRPIVLDNPPGFLPKQDDDNDKSDNGSGSGRVEPRSPRWAVYGRGLDDVSDFFNSQDYQPATTDDTKSQGRQKMFTKEEKVLMNARIPKVDVATSQKWLPLLTLAASGEFYLANNLLKYEVDINAADQDGLTALHKAITCKKQAVTEYLLRESADPFICDKDGATLMHYAVRTASSQAIKTLLLHNVDINLQDNDGWTPLHLAVQARRTDVVRLLLMRGANKTLKNQDGLTPVELCLYSGRNAKTYELIKLLKQLPRQRHLSH